MNILEFLQQRASIPANYLTEPGPDAAAIKQICSAGLSAPDHAAIRPWRFIVIEGKQRNKLGEVFEKVAREESPAMPEAKISRIRAKPLRSPTIIAVVARIKPGHPKTPEIEQIISAGAAAQQIQLACQALGFGSVWLTGPNAYSKIVKNALGVDNGDHIVGFLYIGTPSIEPPKPRRPAVEDHLEYWSG